MTNASRRDFMKAAGAAGTAIAGIGALSGFSCSKDRKNGVSTPNVLIIMCDQLNANALGCYGGPVPTPNIDRIAREGARFLNATCPAPFCSPSRASMITGMYPHAHGIVYNVDANCEGIHPSDITTEGILFSSGYETTHFGKWHLHDGELPYYETYYREQYGMEMKEILAEAAKLPPDERMMFYGQAWPVDVSPEVKEAVKKLGNKWDDVIYADFIKKMGRLRLPPEKTFDVRYADEAVKQLQSAGPAPFMLTTSFIWPHDPNFAPSPYYEMFGPEDAVIPANAGIREARFERDWSRRAMADLDEASLREFLRIYYATVRLVDDQVGRILAVLDEKGIIDDTIIIFTADHGDMMGGHGMVWKSTASFYDEIVRVPLLIRYPRRVAPHKTDLAACMTDIMPTILDFTGQEIPGHVQGHSLAPYISGEKSPSDAPAYTFCERVPGYKEKRRGVRTDAPGNFMICGEGWKYIRYGDGDEYLYNLNDDPGETKNLAQDAAILAEKKRLRSLLDEWLTRTGYPIS